MLAVGQINEEMAVVESSRLFEGSIVSRPNASRRSRVRRRRDRRVIYLACPRVARTEVRNNARALGSRLPGQSSFFPEHSRVSDLVGVALIQMEPIEASPGLRRPRLDTRSRQLRYR
jgi:hypothetical protein